jgi:tryptophan halogenase
MKIFIVGGGSAGWMTATTLLTAKPNWEINLIESKNISTVGVGESTLEYIINWCHYVGIDEEKFLKETDASYKLSIKFTDFYKKGEAFHYPFGSPDLTDNFNGTNDWWFKKFLYPKTPNSDYADCIFPKQMAYVNENKFDKECTKAYHFDATKFALWLKKNKCQKVNHIVEDVVSIEQDENGIKSLNNKHTADLFIDCTGFKSLLLGETLKEPFESYENLLPNNSAIATKLEYTDKEKQLETYTNCTAYNNGWIWNIPLWSRIGTGYVYSDKFVSDDDAIKEFKTYLGKDDLEFKKIKMRIGIHKRLWVKNVIGIGLSAGFIEPLESNGLWTVHQFLMNLIRNIQREKISQWDKDNFTYMCKDDFQSFAEFVALHYALSQRTDTEYWKANFNKEWDNNLISLKKSFPSNLKLLSEDRKFNYIFSSLGGSHCIAAGMNWSPTDLDTLKYNLKNDFYNMKLAWLNSIKKLNRKKEKGELNTFNKPSLYKYLKENIHG